MIKDVKIKIIYTVDLQNINWMPSHKAHKGPPRARHAVWQASNPISEENVEGGLPTRGHRTKECSPAGVLAKCTDHATCFESSHGIHERRSTSHRLSHHPLTAPPPRASTSRSCLWTARLMTSPPGLCPGALNTQPMAPCFWHTGPRPRNAEWHGPWGLHALPGHPPLGR